MPIYEFRPFYGDIDRELDRLLNHYQRQKRAPVQFGVRTWKPLLDLFETPDVLVALVELAGVSLDQLEVVVEGQTLTIRGSRGEQSEQRPTSYHVMEINYGPFERAIPLPTRVDAEQTTARVREGMLEVTMPKQQPRHISISVTVEGSGGR